MRAERAAAPARERAVASVMRRCIGRRRRAAIRSSVHRKLRVLERIVPGCREAEMADLLRRTAEYISLLEVQVSVLKSFADLYGV
ncbi:unnamed protein product [Spirodela intermedia]|uniref:Uncharacterized protein n=1 Tax=Spirodela intermedia TaxID=51605 RepID=A0A7I8KLK4_SPIIN|nr:unnamed protein product [Spirodela intermedia]